MKVYRTCDGYEFRVNHGGRAYWWCDTITSPPRQLGAAPLPPAYLPHCFVSSFGGGPGFTAFTERRLVRKLQRWAAKDREWKAEQDRPPEIVELSA